MTTTTLKWIAIITMIIDHIGAVFFPGFLEMRIIGRLAFPIFAFLIAEGVVHTRSIKKYALRLLLFAFVSEIPFDSAFFSKPLEFTHQNVFFTLFLGVVSLYLYERLKERQLMLGLIAVFAIALLAEFLNTDYALFGVLMIFCIYSSKTLWTKSLWIIAINLLLGISIQMSGGSLIQCLAGVSALFILLYNGQKGNGPKYLFYSIYPAHLIIISLVNYYFG